MADADSNSGDPLSSDSASTGHSVRLMCSFGGRIIPRPHDHQLRYVGGDTRIVAIARHTSWPSLLSKLAKLSGSSPDSAPPTVKYQLPNEDLDALVSLTSEEDLDNMMDEYDRLLLLSSPSRPPPRLRLFLFTQGASTTSSSSSSSATALGSLLESSASKRDTWFVDALNGSAGSGPPPPLERGRSEASSVISEVPDYLLFGLDSKSSEPSSPAIATSSPHYYSASSTMSSVPGIPDIITTPIKNKSEPPVQSVPNPVYYVQDPVPVYYVPTSMPVRPMLYGTVYGGPVYVGGPPGAFEYQGGLVYPPSAVGQVGGEMMAPPGVVGPEMRNIIGPTSSHISS